MIRRIPTAMEYIVTSWILEFHGHPLSPNDHVGWRTRMRWAKHWKTLACVEAKRQDIPKLERIRISAVIVRSRLGVADADNDMARIKPVLDGIVAAGVITDDRREFVEWGDVTEERGPKGLRVTVEAL